MINEVSSVNHTESRYFETREFSERGDEGRVRFTPYSLLSANLSHPAHSNAAAIGALATSMFAHRASCLHQFFGHKNLRCNRKGATP